MPDHPFIAAESKPTDIRAKGAGDDRRQVPAGVAGSVPTGENARQGLLFRCRTPILDGRVIYEPGVWLPFFSSDLQANLP
ncbi:hypothetical protein DYI37_04795 [Fulvimarina endophytica]|uniref:Uncharacterized protein n=1 Tax=Fulvimarina endophytica TaxID=2293836 RepID=A0A371X7G1_9HYPH|nr:hypothetical protein DYI37_04795 [Fulvimarina endophytica]